MRWFVSLAFVACSAAPRVPEPAPAQPPSPPPPATARDVMDRVVATYAAFTSYQDTGEVRTNWAHKPRPDEIRFKTIFREPDRILVEWFDHHPYRALADDWRLNAVWSNGKGAFYFWDTRHAVEQNASLKEMLRATSGVSKLVTITVPSLLVDEMRIPPPKPLDDLHLLPPEVVEGVPCYRVKGWRDGATYELSIGRDDFLVRRVLETPEPGFLDGKLLWTEWTYRDIQVDRAIADAVFDYRPLPTCMTDPWECPDDFVE